MKLGLRNGHQRQPSFACRRSADYRFGGNRFDCHFGFRMFPDAAALHINGIRCEKGEADRAAMFAQAEPLTKPLTLADAVARVLRDILDGRAKMMEEAVSMGQLDLDQIELLPNLVASCGYLGRSDHATVTSRNAVTGQPALSDPYYSTDRDRRVGELTRS
jgi:hypothetical protein